MLSAILPVGGVRRDSLSVMKLDLDRSGAPISSGNRLVAVGRFVAAIHSRLGPATDSPADEQSDRLPTLPPPPVPVPGRPCPVAASVCDAGFAGRLAAALAPGAERRRPIRERVAHMGRIELEGLALGSHLPTTRIIDDLDEVRLQTAPV
jgi:hypothetical protein